MPRYLACLVAIVLVCCQASLAAEPAVEPWDIAIVAPHSDDEAIGCTAVMLRALADKKRVGVVIVTAGDAHVGAAAALVKKSVEQLTPADFEALAGRRQQHTLDALKQLGLQRDDIVMLGYPDGGMQPIYEAAGDEPYKQKHTGRTATYGPIVRDYHTLTHGAPAPYRKASVIADLAETFRTHRPQQIYTTNEADTHADHRAVMWYVRDAVAKAEFRGKLYTYVVHGRPPTAAPSLRLQLTAAELRRKRATIEIYQAGVSPVHDDLADHYALPEELFWAVELGAK